MQLSGVGNVVRIIGGRGGEEEVVNLELNRVTASVATDLNENDMSLTNGNNSIECAEADHQHQPVR